MVSNPQIQKRDVLYVRVSYCWFVACINSIGQKRDIWAVSIYNMLLDGHQILIFVATLDGLA